MGQPALACRDHSRDDRLIHCFAQRPTRGVRFKCGRVLRTHPLRYTSLCRIHPNSSMDHRGNGTSGLCTSFWKLQCLEQRSPSVGKIRGGLEGRTGAEGRTVRIQTDGGRQGKDRSIQCGFGIQRHGRLQFRASCRGVGRTSCSGPGPDPRQELHQSECHSRRPGAAGALGEPFIEYPKEF